MNFDDLSSGDLEPPKKAGLFGSIIGGAKNLIQRSLSRSRAQEARAAPDVPAALPEREQPAPRYQREEHVVIPAKLLIAFERAQRGQELHSEEQDRKIAELHELVKALSDENRALKAKADELRQTYVDMAKSFGNQTMVLKLPTMAEPKQEPQPVVKPVPQPKPVVVTSASTTQPEQPKQATFTFGAALGAKPAEKEAAKPAFTFSAGIAAPAAPATAASAAPKFTFGGPAPKPSEPPKDAPAPAQKAEEAKPAPKFTFGAPSENKEAPKFTFGEKPKEAGAQPKFTFGQGGDAPKPTFTFGTKQETAEPPKAQEAPKFTFGQPAEKENKPAFTFGQSNPADQAKPTFSFGGSNPAG